MSFMNKRRRLADVPYQVAVNQSSQSSRVHSSNQTVASPTHSIVTALVVDPLSFTPCGRLSEMDNPSAISCSTRSGKNGKSNITDRVNDDSSHEIDCHPPPDDEDLLVATNSDSSYEAVALLTSENTFTQDGLNQALLCACRRGHKLLVQTLVRVGANIEHHDEHGNTPLLICAENGFIDIVQFLVSRHANVNAVNFVDNTSLILSVCSAGAIDLTRFLVEQQDVDVHHENQHGHTALNRATQFMDVDTMKLLLEKSMCKKPDREYRQVFPSEYDTDNCFINRRSLEIKQHHTVDKTRLGGLYEILQDHLTTGTSPLELAIKAGDTKSLDMLLDCQFSSKEEKKRYVDSALKYVFQNQQHDNVQRFSSTDVQIIQKLLQYGADVNQVHEKKLISLAVESGNLQVVELLCTHGADLKGYYSSKEDPLVIAAKHGHQDLITFLLKYKSGIDRLNFSDSALDHALRNDHTECAKLLIQHGAKMDVKSALRSAIDHQVTKYIPFLFENCDIEVMDYISQQPQDVRQLLTSAAEKGNCEIIGQILNAGISVNQTDWNGQTPLMASKNREVAEFLIQRGADINRKIERRNGSDTVLSHVIKSRNCKDKSTVELCKVLIDNGASVNCGIGKDKTPLIIAAQDNCVDMLQMLLDHGADVNIKNRKGITPLILSVRDGNVPIVKELLENGADVNIKDKRENTALHHLLMGYHGNREEILTSLIKAGSHVNWQNSDGLSPLMLATKKKMTSLISQLLVAGADVNAVSKKNNSQTALSFMSDCELNLRNDTRSCIKTLLDGGASSSYLSREYIHKLIIGNHVNIILKLIQNGAGPADVDSMQMRIRLSGVPSTVSPLCLALLLGKLHLARYFVDILFLTSSDLSMFASNNVVDCLLQREDQKDSLRFLHELSSQPMSLSKLCLVAVNAVVGSYPGRETRVDSLPLDQMLKEKLLFKSVGSENAAIVEIPSESFTAHDSARMISLLRYLEIIRYVASDDFFFFAPSDASGSDDDNNDAFYNFH